MDRIAVFGALAKHSLDFAIYAWPVSLAVLATFLAALFFRASGRALISRRAPLISATYVFPIVVLLAGAALRYDWNTHPSWVEPAAWRPLAVWAVVILHIAVLLLVAYSATGARWRSTAFLLPGVWLSLSCAFVAVIAVVGVGP